MNKRGYALPEALRKLTPKQARFLAEQRRAFADVAKEIAPTLVDFADRLGLPEPGKMEEDPGRFLRSVKLFLEKQEITESDAAWTGARVAYFVGEVLNQRLGGAWHVNENPESRYFGQVVIGNFERVKNPAAQVDPFEVAVAFLQAPKGRDLAELVNEVEQAVRKA